jgi:hypothetical protein
VNESNKMYSKMVSKIFILLWQFKYFFDLIGITGYTTGDLITIKSTIFYLFIIHTGKTEDNSVSEKVGVHQPCDYFFN